MRRRAHLQRAVVFVRKGLWDLALADVEAAIALVLSTGAVLAPAEREMCARALNGTRGSAELLAQPDQAVQLVRTLRAPGGEVVAAPMALGLARSIEWHLHRRRLRDAAELSFLLWKISGWREWRYLLNRRLKSSVPSIT